MDRLFSGYELLMRWGFNPIDLYQYVQSGALTPLGASGNPIPHPFWKEYNGAKTDILTKVFGQLIEKISDPNNLFSSIHDKISKGEHLKLENDSELIPALLSYYLSSRKVQLESLSSCVSENGLGWQNSKLPGDQIKAEEVLNAVSRSFYTQKQFAIVDQIIKSFGDKYNFGAKEINLLMEAGKEALEIYEHVVKKIGATDKTPESRKERRDGDVR